MTQQASHNNSVDLLDINGTADGVVFSGLTFRPTDSRLVVHTPSSYDLHPVYSFRVKVEEEYFQNMEPGDCPLFDMVRPQTVSGGLFTEKTSAVKNAAGIPVRLEWVASYFDGDGVQVRKHGTFIADMLTAKLDSRGNLSLGFVTQVLSDAHLNELMFLVVCSDIRLHITTSPT